MPETWRAQADKELALIARKRYAPYFLTVHDAVHYARSQDILCQGRGSAANSVVCYALGITSISPEVGTMVFERFVSDARDEPPDIDVDFEHERREEVIQYIYDRFGRERAGICATVIHYRGKRAVREVGTAMGLSRDTVAALSSQIWGWGGGDMPRERLVELGLDPDDRRMAQTMESRRGRSSASPATSASTSAASSSPRDGSTSWSRSRTRRWRSAPSSAGTRTTSTPSASSRSTSSGSAC